MFNGKSFFWKLKQINPKRNEQRFFTCHMNIWKGNTFFAFFSKICHTVSTSLTYHVIRTCPYHLSAFVYDVTGQMLHFFYCIEKGNFIYCWWQPLTITKLSSNFLFCWNVIFKDKQASIVINQIKGRVST